MNLFISGHCNDDVVSQTFWNGETEEKVKTLEKDDNKAFQEIGGYSSISTSWRRRGLKRVPRSHLD